MGRPAFDPKHHVPRIVHGVMLASRLGTAMMLNRHPDQVSRHCEPVACDVQTRLELYEVEAVEVATKHRKRRAA